MLKDSCTFKTCSPASIYIIISVMDIGLVQYCRTLLFLAIGNEMADLRMGKCAMIEYINECHC